MITITGLQLLFKNYILPTVALLSNSIYFIFKTITDKYVVLPKYIKPCTKQNDKPNAYGANAILVI